MPAFDMHPPSITAEKTQAPSGAPIFLLKIQAESYELNVWLRPEEIGALDRVRAADWDQRGSLALGRAAGASVFWCADERGVSIMVGHDDETWDLCVTISPQTLDDILQALQDASP